MTPDAGHDHARPGRVPAWRRYLRFFGARGADDVDDELRFHVEMRVRDYMHQGMSEADARAATLARLGDMVAARDQCVTIATRRERQEHRSQTMDAIRQDLAFALRTLGRNRGWTAVAILTLALGIGANSAMFSVVNQLLLQPLPYPDADRIVLLSLGANDGNMPADVTVVPEAARLRYWRSAARSAEAIEPYETSDMTLTRPGAGVTPEAVRVAQVLPTFFEFAGERPLMGRVFTAAEAHDGAVGLLAEPAWRARFGGDPSIIGTSVRLNGQPVTIIGIAPAELALPREAEVQVWRPLNIDDDEAGFRAMARLRPGTTPAMAQQELDRLSAEYEQRASGTPRMRTLIQRPAELVSFRDSLVMLSAAVALVLLIACANVVHLLLARAARRERELAIRSALGAGSGRLFRQLLTESLVLASAGALAGVLAGWLLLRAMVAMRPDALRQLGTVRMDAETFGATAVVALVMAVVFGVIGALQARRHATADALKAGSSGGATAAQQGRARVLLVVTEMALCTMLLVGATLLLRSVWHLHHKELGFNASGLYWVAPRLSPDRYPTPASKQEFRAQLRERLARMPSVSALSVATAPPTARNYTIGTLQREGDPEPESSAALNRVNHVERDYFRFMGIRLVAGTSFTDTTDAAGQVVINEALARQLWPGEEAIGRRLRIVYANSPWRTVVGVTANIVTDGLTGDINTPLMYFPLPGGNFFNPTLLVRTDGDPRTAALLASTVHAIDSLLPPATVRNAETALRATAAQPRFLLLLLSVFAGVAVGLAAIGLYGVLSYTVTLRTREIGIRMALGATRRAVAGTVLREGLLMTGAGAVLGLIAARWGARLMEHTVHGIPATDAWSFASGALVLGVIAVVACVTPTRRAVGVDPMTAIRAD